MAARSTLTASGVHAGYPGRPVLAGVDLSISAGDPPLGLVGPSGVGKTTLIDVLRGALKPSAGRAVYDGRPVGRIRGAARKVFRADARFMSQDSMLITDPRETARRRLELASKEARKSGRTHGVSEVEMLEAVGLGEQHLERAIRTLSGGEQQRVALATALATRPQILVLDEPLTAIDPATRGEIAGHLQQMIDELGIGLLVASHDLELVNRLCPQVAFLAEGRIVARGELDDVLANPAHEAVRELAVNAPLAVQRFS